MWQNSDICKPKDSKLNGTKLMLIALSNNQAGIYLLKFLEDNIGLLNINTLNTLFLGNKKKKEEILKIARTID